MAGNPRSGLGADLLSPSSYEAVGLANDPEAALLASLRSTYSAAADLLNWIARSWSATKDVPGRAPFDPVYAELSVAIDGWQSR